jgi:ribonuclease-3
MTRRAQVELATLEARLGHTFKDRELATLALTHLSAQATTSQGRPKSYQRLEFLGDRVLGLAIAEMLYRAFPLAEEGALSMRLATLVRRETCAEVAREWDVGPRVALGIGEAQAGGRKKEAILSDVCESIIGAVFIDAGFEAARALIERSWQARMYSVAEPERDAKTAMQEWAQARGLPAPTYVEVERSGPAHSPQFVMQVMLKGYEPVLGAAPSKRAAEQAAAKAFMARWDQQ